MLPQQYRLLTAQGLARALLAGSTEPAGLLARSHAALGHAAPWLPALLNELPQFSAATWDRLTVTELAQKIVRTDAFSAALHEPGVFIRHWILRPSRRVDPPLGLDHLTLPALDDHRALADWLGIPTDELRWFTALEAVRRERALHRQHYSFRLLPKPHGGGRLIEAPRQRLKALQQQVLHGLLDHVPTHEACHGFVRERSVLTHAQCHVGQAVVLHYDLQHFFTSIGAAKVKAVFQTLGFPPGVAETLTALCTVSTPEPVTERLREDGWANWQQARALRSPHLAQGAPSSPMLANLCAFQLDLRMDGLAWALGGRYSRYADDLVISGPADLARNHRRITARVEKLVASEGYQLNRRKTRVSTQATAQQVCGVVVNQHPNLNRSEFDRLRAVLHQCVLHGPATQNRDGVQDFRAHLRGRIAWALQLNPARARRLQALWQRINWSMPDAG